MISQVEYLEGVKSYEVIDEDILCFNYERYSDTIFFYSLKDRMIVQEIKASMGFSSIQSNGNNILLSDSSGVFKVYDNYKSNFSFADEGFKLGNNISFEGLLSVYRGKIFDRHFGIYNISARQSIWIKEETDLLTQINGFFISQKGSILRSHAPISGNAVWSLDFREIISDFDVNRSIEILCCAKNKIVIGSEKNNLICVICALTGKVLWMLKNSITHGVQISHNSKYLFRFQVNFIKYDFDSGEKLDSMVDNSIFVNKDFQSQRDNYVVKDHLVFSTDWKNSNVGCIDSNNMNLKWVQKIGNTGYPASKKMKVIGGRLFLHGANNQLVICDMYLGKDVQIV